MNRSPTFPHEVSSQQQSPLPRQSLLFFQLWESLVGLRLWIFMLERSLSIILFHFSLEKMCNSYLTDHFTKSKSTFNWAQCAHLLFWCSLHLPAMDGWWPKGALDGFCSPALTFSWQNSNLFCHQCILKRLMDKYQPTCSLASSFELW